MKEPFSIRLATNPMFTIPLSVIATGLNLLAAIEEASVSQLLFSFGAIFVFTILNVRVYREHKKEAEKKE